MKILQKNKYQRFKRKEKKKKMTWLKTYYVGEGGDRVIQAKKREIENLKILYKAEREREEEKKFWQQTLYRLKYQTYIWIQ